ncbi:MAG: hypothetical protein WB713_06610 [Methyloceanibacter sp.]
MTYLPKFARVIAFAGVHMLTPAWGQTHDAQMGGTTLAMTEIASGELKRGDRLMAEATPPAPPHSVPQIDAVDHRRGPDRGSTPAAMDRRGHLPVRDALP